MRGLVGFHRPVTDGTACFLGDGLGQRFRPGVLVVQAAARPVPAEPVPDVEVLLEVVPERHVDEGPPGRGELHRGGQATLHHGQVIRR